MKRSKVIFLNAFLASLMALAGLSCSHAPVRAPLEESEMEELSSQMEAAIVKELHSNKSLSNINEIKTQDQQQSADGLVLISYHLSYDTDSAEVGKVTTLFDAQATLEQEGENWKVTQIAPKSQKMIFQQALVVTGKLPKAR